jgi:hypothetical protein
MDLADGPDRGVKRPIQVLSQRLFGQTQTMVPKLHRFVLLSKEDAIRGGQHARNFAELTIFLRAPAVI